MQQWNDEPETILQLSIPSELGCEKLVRQTLAGFLPGLGFDGARVADVQTAISEACINAVEHGNQGLPGLRLSVTLSVTPEHVEAVVADEGISNYKPGAGAPATIEQKLAGLAPARGMGLMLIRQLVDEAEFLPAQPGCGNRLRMIVHRSYPVSPHRFAGHCS